MKKYCIFMMLALLYVVGQAQTKVTGVVTSSEDGQTLPGVSVVVKGTDTGVITNIDGNYSIEVPGENPVLVFTFVGMTPQEIPIEGRSKIDVVMNPSIIDLDEVVVIAYGSIKKASFTGSASVVDKKKLEKITSPTLNKALLGSTPGLSISTSSGQPGSQSTVRIRGTGSLAASSRPLFVLDGIPIKDGDYTNEIATATSSDVLSILNIADIESMTFLKDAAAASMYGSAAANGVVLITTKKGKSGESTISFSTKFGFNTLQKNKYDLMNASQIYKIYYDAYYTEGLANNAADPVAYANSETATALTFNPYNVDNPLDASGNLVSGATLLVDNNWMDVITNTAITRDYNLQAKGGTEKINYFASAGYSFHDGNFVASDFEKFSGKLNLSSKVNDYVKVGMENTVGHTIKNSAPGGGAGASIFSHGLRLSNVIPTTMIDSLGNPLYNEQGKPIYNYSNPVAQTYNPIGLSEMNKYQSITFRTISSFWTEINFLKDFKYKSVFNADYFTVNNLLYWNPFYGDGNSYVGVGDKFFNKDLIWTFSNTLDYTKKINDHTINALVGYEATEREYAFAEARATNYVILGDVLLPELDNAATPTDARSYTLSSAKSSAFGRISYSFKNRYYFTGSLRNDGSSKFGPDKKFGTFYSLSAAWRISDEAFMSGFSWLNDLKLRASHGTSGNDGIDNFLFLALYSTRSYNDQPGYYHSQLPNAVLQWESMVTSNIGADFRLFDKLELTYDFYIKKSTELLYEKPLPGNTGFTNIFTNFASLKNSGHEIELRSNIIATNDFQLDLSLNFAANKDELLQIANEEEYDSDYYKLWKKGGSIYEFYLKEWAGVDKATGGPLWYMDDENGNKVLTDNWNDATRYEVGKSTPDAFGTFITDIKYKGFELSAMLFYSIGGKILDETERALFYTGGGNKGHNLTNAIQDHWTPDNPDAKYPRFVIDEDLNSYSRSTLFLHDATYMQLKSIRLDYSIPTKILSKVYLSGATVFASAENLFKWYKDKDLKTSDPGLGLHGIEYYRAPAPITISFGIKLDM